jgi:hypothetical protein
MDLEKIRKSMVKGRPARLFPVLPESKKEERATSILLSVFTVVPDLAREILSSASAPIGKRSTVTCFTEVSFKGVNSKSRPDGLVVVSTTGKEWVALVETKVGRNDLTTDQVEGYLDIAREQGFDAVITISNQFAALPTHHPVNVNKTKTRTVELFHFSWLSIISKSILLVDSKTVSDVEQSFMLKELIRFLEDDASGILSNARMSSDWKDTCNLVHQNTPLKKSDDAIAQAVSDWHQLVRYLSIRLSVSLGESCNIWMPRKHTNNPPVRLAEDVTDLVTKQSLTTEIEIPNAAGRIEMVVSLLRKTLDLRVNVDTPKDVKQQRTAINFVLSQLKDSTHEDILIRVNWPRRVAATELPLQRALDEDEKKALVPDNFKDLPTSIDIIRIVDLGGKLKTATGLPEIAEHEVIRFYQDVVQGLKRWVPEAPKVRKKPETNKQDSKEIPSQSVISIIEEPIISVNMPDVISWKQE